MLLDNVLVNWWVSYSKLSLRFLGNDAMLNSMVPPYMHETPLQSPQASILSVWAVSMHSMSTVPPHLPPPEKKTFQENVPKEQGSKWYP